MPTLEWIGKDKVVNHHQEVPYRVLERQYSYDEAGQHAEDNGIELEISATSVESAAEVSANYDVILMGPQVSYQLNTVKQGSGKPTAVIPAQDYGMGNAANVLALAQSLLG